MIKSFRQTSKYLGIAENTLRKIIQDDQSFPNAIKLSERRIGFRLSDIDDWLETRQIARP